MPGNGDLIRSMRAGGSSGVAAAQEMLRRAQAGAVSPSELKEVQRVVTSPELRDAFGAVARQFGALDPGTEGVFRDVETLTPDTNRLTDARTLPERFISDLRLVEQPLLMFGGLSRQQKAARLFAFFETYAARFQALSTGDAQLAQAAKGAETGLTLAPPLSEAELGKALGQFEKALGLAGFRDLKAADGRSGLEVARQMLEARTPAAQREARPSQLDAPGWKDNERAPRPDGPRTPMFDAKPVIQPPRGQAPTSPEEAQQAKRSKDRTSDKVLGGRMVWNVLHLLRGEDLDDVAKRDAMTQLAIAAALLLLLGSILVGVLVLM